MNDLLGGEKGMKTAVAQAHDPAAKLPEDVDGEQLTLLPLHNIEDGQTARERGVSAPRGRGRPPGAQNKSTEAWTEYLLARYRSPLEGMAVTFCRPVQDLARELGCSKLEAFKLQVQCMSALAPYIHKKQPIAIDAGEGGLMQLVINTGSHAHNRGDQSSDYTLKMLSVESEQNQALNDEDLQELDAAQLDDHDQSFENKEQNQHRADDLKSDDHDHQGGGA